MSELSPQITYSPEGVLEVRRTLDEDIKDEVVVFSAHKERIDTLPGYEVIEEGLDTVVRVDVSKVTRSARELNFRNPSAERLIQNLRRFTGFVGYEDATDHVFSLDYWADYGSGGVIYPQFQRWLNAGGLDENIARECVNAMAYPFGAEARKQAKKDFSYKTDGESAAAGVGGFTFGVISRREDFGISTYDEMGEEPVHKYGKVAWNWVDLSTIGNCACWGAGWQERELVYIRPESNRLYEMGPHNVDFAVQSLSLVLGAATLAYEATRYSGNEDILANAEWHES